MRFAARAVPLVAAVLLGVGCGAGEAPPEVVEQSVRPARVAVVEAPSQLVSHELVARVEAAQSVDLSFEVSGVLAELPVREGRIVKRGALVAALDPTDFRLAVQEAEAQLQLARQDLQRKQRMLMGNHIAVSLVEDARTLCRLLQVRLQQRQEALAKTRITAPFDAYVARRYIDNFVRLDVDDPVARLNDLQELLVVASIPERLTATISTEQVASLEAAFPFAPGRRFPLEHRENRGEADAVAQTYEVSLAMRRPEGFNVLPGMTAAVHIALRRADQAAAAVIPASALVSGPDKAFFVWIYEPDSKRVRKQPVRVAAPTADGIPVRYGLSGGELVVVAGATQLQAGMRIRPLPGGVDGG